MQNRSSQMNPIKGDEYSPQEEIINSQQFQNNFKQVINHTQIPQDPILRLKKKNSRNTTPEVAQIPSIICSYEQLQNIQQNNQQQNSVLKKLNLPSPSKTQKVYENEQTFPTIQQEQAQNFSQKTNQHSPRSYSAGFTPVIHSNLNQLNNNQFNIHTSQLNHKEIESLSPFNVKTNQFQNVISHSQQNQQSQGSIQQVNGLTYLGSFNERSQTPPQRVNQLMKQSYGVFDRQNSNERDLANIQSRSQILNLKISQCSKVLNGKDDTDIPSNPLKKITQKPLLNKTSSLVFDTKSISGIPSIQQLPNILPPQIPLPAQMNPISSTPIIKRVNNHSFQYQSQIQPSPNSNIQMYQSTFAKSFSPNKNSSSNLERDRKQSPEKLLSTAKPVIMMQNSQLSNYTQKSLSNIPSNHVIQDHEQMPQQIQPITQFQNSPQQLPTIYSNIQKEQNLNQFNFQQTFNQFNVIDNEQPEYIKQTSSILEQNNSIKIQPIHKTSEIIQKEQIEQLLHNQHLPEFEKQNLNQNSSPNKQKSIESTQEYQSQLQNSSFKEKNQMQLQSSFNQSQSQIEQNIVREGSYSQINSSPNKLEGKSISNYKNSQILLRNTIDQLKNITKFPANNIDPYNNNNLIEQKNDNHKNSVNYSQEQEDMKSTLNNSQLKNENYQKRLQAINTQIDELKRKNLDSTKNIENTIYDLMRNEQFIEQQLSEFKDSQNQIEQKQQESYQNLKQSVINDLNQDFQQNNLSSEKLLNNLEQFQEKQNQLQQQQIQLQQQQQQLLQEYQLNQSQQLQQQKMPQQEHFEHQSQSQNQVLSSQQQKGEYSQQKQQPQQIQLQQLENNLYQYQQKQQLLKQECQFQIDNQDEVQILNQERQEYVAEDKIDTYYDNEHVQIPKNLSSSYNEDTMYVKRSKELSNIKETANQAEDIAINQNINMVQQNFNTQISEDEDNHQNSDRIEQDSEQFIIQQLTQQSEKEISNQNEQYSLDINNNNNDIVQKDIQNINQQKVQEIEIAKKLSGTQSKVSSNLFQQKDKSSPGKNSPNKKKDISSPLRRIKNEIKKSIHGFQETKNSTSVHKTMADLNHNKQDSKLKNNEISQNDSSQKNFLPTFKVENNSSQQISNDSSGQIENTQQQKQQQSIKSNNNKSNISKNKGITSNNSIHNKQSSIIQSSSQSNHPISESKHSQSNQLNQLSSSMSSTKQQPVNQQKSQNMFNNLNQGFATSSRESIMQQFMYLNSLTNKKQQSNINTQPDQTEKLVQNDTSLTQSHLKRPTKTNFTSSQQINQQTKIGVQKKNSTNKKDLNIEVDSMINKQDRSLPVQTKSNQTQTMNEKLTGKSNTPKFSETQIFQTQGVKGNTHTTSANNYQLAKKQENNQNLEDNYVNNQTQPQNQQNNSQNGKVLSGQQLLEKIQNHLVRNQNEIQVFQNDHQNQDDQEDNDNYFEEDNQQNYEEFEDNQQNINETDLQYYSNPQITNQQNISKINKQSQATQQKQIISTSNIQKVNGEESDEQDLYAALNDLNSRLKEKTNRIATSVERSNSGQLNSKKFLSKTPERAVTETYDDSNQKQSYSQKQLTQIQSNPRLNKSEIQMKQKNSSQSPMKGSYVQQQQKPQSQLDMPLQTENKTQNNNIISSQTKMVQQELNRVFDVYSKNQKQQNGKNVQESQSALLKNAKQPSFDSSQSPVKQPQYIQKKGVSGGHKKNQSVNIKQLNYLEESANQNQNQQEINYQTTEDIQPKKKTYSGMHFKKQVYTIVKDVEDQQQQQSIQSSQILKKESKDLQNNIDAQMKERSFEFWAEKIKNSDNPKQILDVWKMINSVNKAKQ